jgi:K+-sensing histidine kinase KdpD
MIVAGERAQACLDYFFTEPRFRMRIDASEDVMAVAAFATTSFVTAELVGRVRRLGEAAALKDRLQIIIDTIPAVAGAVRATARPTF